jgi:CelD/BcsL family acetyltransferase involved in cellulose biosynthesis
VSERGTSERNQTLRTVRFDALTDRELDAWHALRDANPALDSPYFHPGFAEAVHLSGREVRVVVSQDGGEVSGLLPVHRDGALLRPVGWPGADFQGPVLRPGTSFPAAAMLGGGVRGFAFDHLVDVCPDFDPGVESTRPSPYVDVDGGLDGYLGRASRSGKENLGQARRRARKAEKELGPVQFVADNPDRDLLEAVIRLKRAQYAATGARDYFAEADRITLLNRLLGTRGTAFGGILSTVHAGPHLIAAHFGLRAGHVLHWWFPVYDPEFGHLAPGWILLRELIAAAPGVGFTRIDLGRGDDEYKRRAKTGEILVSQGMLTRGPIHRMLRQARNRTIDTVKSSALGPALRQAVRRARTIKRPTR